MFSDSTLFRPDRRRIIATVCLALALAVGFLASPRSAEAFCRSASAARNLRIFTYNVHGIPAVPGDLDGNEDIYQDSDENRMIAIAEEILEDDPDIVALSEVWQEDGGGKATFIKMLAKRYPFSIRYVRGISTVGAHIPKSGSSGLSDSGLMLFSKDPFMKFSQNVPTDPLGYVGFEACNGPACAEWGPLHAADEVAVRTYAGGATGECAGSDCSAQKAAIMVRLQGACPYSVVWTHTDADWSVTGESPLDDQNARKKQLAIVKDLINASLTATQKDQEPIFFVGDLNVDGNFAPSPQVQMPFDNGSGSTEYGVQFDPADPNAAPHSLFFGCKNQVDNALCKLSSGGRLLTDAWAHETSPTDFGPTNHATPNAFDFNFKENIGDRLDYIFHSNPVDPEVNKAFMCMQHITRDFKLTDPERSDHMALRADFNGSFARCNARLRFPENPQGPANGAAPVEFDGTGNKTFDDSSTKLRFPGSNQWYLVDEVGTFAAAIEQSGAPSTKIGVAVYHHDDLSQEKDSFHKETSTWTPNVKGAVPVTALKYQFDDPPYLVRVYGMVDATLPDLDEGLRDPDFHKPDRSFPAPSAFGEKYTIHLHMSRCVSVDDSCSLTAGVIRPLSWASQPRNAEDMAYFTFDTDAKSSTVFPSIHLFVEPIVVAPATPDMVFTTSKVRFFKGSDYDKTRGDCAAGAPPPCNADLSVVASWSAWADTGDAPGMLDRRATITAGGLPPDDPGTPEKHILKIGRPDPNIAFTEMLRYETSLTYFMPDKGGKALVCHIQQSIMYDDQIGLDVKLDSGVPRTDCDHSDCPDLSVVTSGPMSYVGQFDDGGTPHDLGKKFGGRFVTSVMPSLYEDVLNGSDHEYLIFAMNTNSTENQNDLLGTAGELVDATIAPLAFDEGGDAEALKPRVFAWCGNQGGSNVPASQSLSSPLWACGNNEFHYTMGYHLTHDDVSKGQ